MSDIIINNSNVVINTPPNLPPKQRHFKKMLKIGKLRFYVTWDFRLKNSQTRDSNIAHWKSYKVKERLFKLRDHKCEMCGKEFKRMSCAQVHHILPWWRFRQFEFDDRNLLLLCNDCHKEIHNNPFLDCTLQEEKAKELGVNLKDYYEV